MSQSKFFALIDHHGIIMLKPEHEPTEGSSEHDGDSTIQCLTADEGDAL